MSGHSPIPIQRHDYDIKKYKVADKEHLIIEKFVFGEPTKVENLKANINFRAFYNELHDKLIHNEYVRFYDMLGEPEDQKVGDFFDEQVKLGEHVDNKSNMNRAGDMFEWHFQWQKEDNRVNFEMKWKAKAKTPYSAYGWVEIYIDLVNRFLTDKEVLVGNQKVTLQNGTWEFRNKVVYKNNIIPKYLNEIPIVKNSPMLQALYLDHVAHEKIAKDIHLCEHKIVPFLYKIIDKHFKSN